MDTVAGPLNTSPLDMWAKLQTALEEALATQRTRATALLAGAFHAVRCAALHNRRASLALAAESALARVQGLSSTVSKRQPSTPGSTVPQRPRSATASSARPPRPHSSTNCFAGTAARFHPPRTLSHATLTAI